jgi:hypothetical protein
MIWTKSAGKDDWGIGLGLSALRDTIGLSSENI